MINAKEDLFGYGVVKRVLATSAGLAEGTAALIAWCRQQHPHPAWDEVAALDLRSDADAMHEWFLRQLPVADPVQVLWFAPWDVVEGLDLRGGTSWSHDPEDWEWWYGADVDAGSYASPVLMAMDQIARNAEQFPERRFADLTTWVTAAGYVSLAAVEVLSRVDPLVLLGERREELWAVVGYPDAVYGVILGRVTVAGFEPGRPRSPEAAAPERISERHAPESGG